MHCTDRHNQTHVTTNKCMSWDWHKHKNSCYNWQAPLKYSHNRYSSIGFAIIKKLGWLTNITFTLDNYCGYKERNWAVACLNHGPQKCELSLSVKLTKIDCKNWKRVHFSCHSVTGKMILHIKLFTLADSLLRECDL